MKRVLAWVLLLTVCISGCAAKKPADAEENTYVSRFKNEERITLSDEKIELNGETIGENGDVFLSKDIIYYEDKDCYESGNPYGEGDDDDKHTEEEAASHTVLNITKSGAYRVSGALSKGQIRVDLGEDAEKNPDAVVELILDDADITCTVAPVILFMNVYECDEDWSEDSANKDVDTSKAGAVLVLADESENNINGSYVEKIFKDEEGEEKLWKQDGAIYSYMSMNVYGGGTMNLTAENEGLDTELHLTINGGDINIYSQNDGINTNEDNVSVTTINGGRLHIVAGLGEEGDGIDSNGWLVINGGTVTSSANPGADAGLDSDKGSFINGGTVVALGSTMDWPESDSDQVTMNLQFMDEQESGSEIVVKDKNGKVVFSYQPKEQDEAMLRRFRGAVISSPDFKVDGEYTVYVGGTQQGYFGTDVKFGGRKPGNPPELPNGEVPPMPDGEMPPMENGERPQKPESEWHRGEKGERPNFPEGEMSDGARPKMPDDAIYEDAEQKTVFTMSDKVNLFQGVANIK